MLMNNIYILGSINMDLTVSADRFPAVGESLNADDFYTAHGGKGANQAVAAARLGGKVRMCGCVGSDSFGDELVESLKAEGIDTDFIYRADAPTGVAVITVAHGDNMIAVCRGANGCVTEKQVDDFLTSADAGDIFLTQLETDISVTRYALKKAEEKGMFTVLNPAPVDLSAAEFYKSAKCVIPNETELKALTGTEDEEKGLEVLYRSGVELPLATLGSRGCAGFFEGKVRYFDAVRVSSVDPTAAGDTFCGALCTGIASGMNNQQAIAFAMKAAAISVTRKGAQPSIPYLSEIQ